jgi:hypothetical protein
MLRVAVLGLGVISRYYLPALAAHPQCRVTAVCDLNPAKMAGIPVEIAYHENYRAVLTSRDVDAVVVNLPNHLHFRVCRAALLAGKHVCCEKPLTVDPAEAAELEELAARVDRTLFTAFHRRYNRNALRLAERLRDRPPPARTTLTYRERIEDHCGTDAWYLDPERCGGGCVIDNGSNALTPHCSCCPRSGWSAPRSTGTAPGPTGGPSSSWRRTAAARPPSGSTGATTARTRPSSSSGTACRRNAPTSGRLPRLQVVAAPRVRGPGGRLRAHGPAPRAPARHRPRGGRAGRGGVPDGSRGVTGAPGAAVTRQAVHGRAAGRRRDHRGRRRRADGEHTSRAPTGPARWCRPSPAGSRPVHPPGRHRPTSR